MLAAMKTSEGGASPEATEDGALGARWTYFIVFILYNNPVKRLLGLSS